MKALQVVASINEEADGVAAAVLGLAKNMALRGYETTLACATPGQVPNLPCETLFADPFLVLGKDLSFSLARRVGDAAKHFEIVHSHGLWNPINIATGYVVPRKRAMLVCSPHGTLTRWALNHSKYKKRALWPLQRQVLARANLIHVTSESELLDVRRMGFSNPVAIIPIGIDFPQLIESGCSEQRRTLLFLSRIHQKKGIDRLLHAWSQLESQFPSWRLVIAGKGDEGYVRSMRDLAATLTVKRVEFVGPKYGSEKEQLYRTADLFVLPTHSENFGIVVAEALANGCPVVVSRGAPWEGVHANGCGWWIENSVEVLRNALACAMSMERIDLHRMGMAGRDWMLREFSWMSMVDKMVGSYRWLLGEGDCPEWVVLS